MRILSVDLGTKSVGICVSDEFNIIAIPIENYRINENDWNDALKRILKYIKEYKVKILLLGYPLKTTGIKSIMSNYVDEFKNLLEKKTNIKIVLFDERFSTQRGLNLIKNKYNSIEERKKYKDMASAYVMLIDYLSYFNS